jgi:leukotriene-A4 hydrolase
MNIFLLITLIITTIQKEDPSTFSNYFQVYHTHLEGHLMIDFNNSIVKGKIKLYFNATMDGELIILDSNSLIINSIIDCDTGENLKYELDNYFSLKSLGSPLKIYKEYQKNTQFQILILYETTKEGKAIGWLKEEQTLGKKHPYMFSQCQSIFCREMLPIQDTPKIKFTTNIGITVMKPLLALESGIYQNKIDNGDTITYFYEQKIPIPSYLIAIAAGKIEERIISDRIKIYSEVENIEKGKSEFENIELYLQVAESYTNSYKWGDYNLLVLPPSFPFGGMENPQMTFVTPAIIAGDRSEVGTVAHEMSHSWTGNLITNNNWENFWLNEGFTMFLERKIMSQVDDEDLSKLDAMIGYNELLSDINYFGESKSFSAMVPNLLGRNPDEAYSFVPYEKGFNFLYYIEKLINEKAEKDLFRLIFKRYLSKFEGQSISSEDFKNFLYEEIYNNFDKENATIIIEKIKWDDWLYKPGIPEIKNDFSNKYFDEVEKNLVKFYNEELGDDFVKEFNGWHSKVKNYFLASISQDEKGSQLSDNNYNYLRDSLKLKNIGNISLRYKFLKIMLKNKRLDCLEELNEFLSEYGISTYLVELYTNFYKVNKDLALETYEKYKSFYHPIAVTAVDEALRKISLEED